MENTRQIRSVRTSNDQLETYLNFLEANPQFLAGKNTPENPKYLQQKWQELTEKLNCLKGAEKNAIEWKTSLTHWKHQLKSRARKLRVDHLCTGGGQSTNPPMSSFDERALNIFGLITISGDVAVPTMGFNEENSTVDQEESSIDAGQTSNELISINRREPTDMGLKPYAQKRAYTSSFSSAISECVNKMAKLAEDRAKHDKYISEQRLEIDRKNADAMTRMAEAMHVLAQQFRIHSHT